MSIYKKSVKGKTGDDFWCKYLNEDVLSITRVAGQTVSTAARKYSIPTTTEYLRGHHRLEDSHKGYRLKSLGYSLDSLSTITLNAGLKLGPELMKSHADLSDSIHSSNGYTGRRFYQGHVVSIEPKEKDMRGKHPQVVFNWKYKKVPHLLSKSYEGFLEASNDTETVPKEWESVTGRKSVMSVGAEDIETVPEEWASVNGRKSRVSNGDSDIEMVPIEWSRASGKKSRVSSGASIDVQIPTQQQMCDDVYHKSKPKSKGRSKTKEKGDGLNGGSLSERGERHRVRYIHAEDYVKGGPDKQNNAGSKCRGCTCDSSAEVKHRGPSSVSTIQMKHREHTGDHNNDVKYRGCNGASRKDDTVQTTDNPELEEIKLHLIGDFLDDCDEHLKHEKQKVQMF